ncbi:GapR family DNA-binding domain-containing protein [Telmatospirillum sp.]|uniref:GapR family DNA-binding domain-containing protein n=1 Tax=Telmatospirillum sp. TaxID=2079197 RepID=UPI0028426F9D|nr:GapR family DNA-binding domain-containing protein [Telmatospirillum sp.]MDR3436454.1 DUF2312 domain-containing protein [Telmatospirillum sp.]
MDTGSNVDAVLKCFVTEIYDLKVEEKDTKTERKDIIAELKSQGLPVTELLALATQDDDKMQERLEARRTAGALLGKPVFTEELSDEAAEVIREELGDQPVVFAKDRIGAIQGIDEDLHRIKEEIKTKLSAAKSAGLAPKIIMVVVDWRLDPKKREKHEEGSLILEKYLEILED